MEAVIYIAELNDDNWESGMHYNSLVDMPAIRAKWQAFGTDQPMKFVANEERQVIAGPAMIADLPIRRVENGQEYYIVYPAKTITKVLERFAEMNYHNNVNIMHAPSSQNYSVHMIELFQIDRKRGINPPTGFEYLSDGSLWTGYKIKDPILYAACKDTFTGFSIEGIFDLVPAMTEDKKVVEEIIKSMTEIENLLQA